MTNRHPTAPHIKKKNAQTQILARKSTESDNELKHVPVQTRNKYKRGQPEHVN